VNVRNFSLVLALVAFSAGSVFAQDNVYFAGAEGTPNSAFDSGELAVGDTGSVFVYWDANLSNLDTGAFLDIVTDTAGVINFTGGETFEFAIEIAGTPVGNRWTDDMGAGGSFGPGELTNGGEGININAFTVTGGDGILAANNGTPFTDQGYDAAADAFLFARLDYEAVGEGTTSLSVTPGAGGIVNAGATVDATFGSATFTVGGGPVIPEPTTAGLLAMGLVGLVARRRR
jgi:hypothetical protein